MRAVIAQCTKSKRDEPAPARDLYDTSSYFRKQRAYAETADAWFIQSAKYGLVHPDEEIEPYDEHAKDLDTPGEWAESIAADLADRIEPGATVELLGGKRYADPLTPALERRGYEVHEPLRGLKFGPRQSELDRLVDRTLGDFA